MGRRLALPGPEGSSAHIGQPWNVPGKYGSHGELFFFLIKKEPFALTKAVQFKPFVPAETLKACALIGLHLMAAGGVSRSSSSCGVFSPELGGIAGLKGPRCPLWKEEVSCSGNESTVGCEVYEHNNECRTIEVKRGGGALSHGFGVWASCFELPHGHGPFSAKK